MDHEFADRINEEIERYRKALLYYAKQCDWDGFNSKAGMLFDYLEAIELSEIQRKFFKIFKFILIVLTLIIVIILQMNGESYPSLLRFKDSMVIMAIAGSCFELYFFLDFRIYVEHKMSKYKQRRVQFIRNIEKDFKEVIVQPVCSI
jgi:magnesium-transporting ATPase (P-type)